MTLFGGRHVDARVTALAWSRVIQLERQEWVTKRSSWVPSEDVRNVQQHTETSWEMVTDSNPGMPGAGGLPGQQVPGMPSTDGGFGQPATTHLEPRTQHYYTYEELEWQRAVQVRASGTSHDGVAWPAYKVGPGERAGDRKETYSATFTAGDKRYERSLTEAEWRALEPGGSCRLTLGLFGGVKKVAPADAA